MIQDMKIGKQYNQLDILIWTIWEEMLLISLTEKQAA